MARETVLVAEMCVGGLGGDFAFVFFFLKSSEGCLGTLVVGFAPCNSPPRFLAWSAKIKANDVDVGFA
jgi:hypothetical protein